MIVGRVQFTGGEITLPHIEHIIAHPLDFLAPVIPLSVFSVPLHYVAPLGFQVVGHPHTRDFIGSLDESRITDIPDGVDDQSRSRGARIRLQHKIGF